MSDTATTTAATTAASRRERLALGPKAVAAASARALDRAMLHACPRHNAPSTAPCWRIRGDRPGDDHLGVCGSRLRSAGFVPPAPRPDRPEPDATAGTRGGWDRSKRPARRPAARPE